MKLPKLHKAAGRDELRPVMSHILITKENTVVTNSSILVVHKTSELFNNEFVNNIPDEGMYITAEDWKVFTTEFVAVQLDNNLIITIIRKKREQLIKGKKVDKIGDYPSWKFLFKKQKGIKFECGDFGININNTIALHEATGCQNLRFQCFDRARQINVLTNNDCDYDSVKAVIMPMMING